MRDRAFTLGKKVVAEISAHAIRAYPAESCGVIRQGEYVEMYNVASDPLTSFRIADAQLESLSPVEAVVHSHPDGPDCVSAADMRSQHAMDVPFVVITTDGKGATPPFVLDGSAIPESIENRPFRHGVTDCYSLVRDWFYRNRNIELFNFARDWEWWLGKNHQNLYLENYEDAGFKQVPENEPPETGDVFLIRTPRALAVNHAGIYVGDGVGLHHMTARHAYDPFCMPSKISLHRWNHHITNWVRYDR